MGMEAWNDDPSYLQHALCAHSETMCRYHSFHIYILINYDPWILVKVKMFIFSYTLFCEKGDLKKKENVPVLSKEDLFLHWCWSVALRAKQVWPVLWLKQGWFSLQIMDHKVSVSKCVYGREAVFDRTTFMVPKGAEDLRQLSPHRASLQPECVSGCPHAGVKCKLAWWQRPRGGRQFKGPEVPSCLFMSLLFTRRWGVVLHNISLIESVNGGSGISTSHYCKPHTSHQQDKRDSRSTWTDWMTRLNGREQGTADSRHWYVPLTSPLSLVFVSPLSATHSYYREDP